MRAHVRIARVAADTLRAVLGVRELLRRRRLLSGYVLGERERTEVDSEHGLRGLALEAVRGLGESRAHTALERTARPARTEQPRRGGGVLLVRGRLARPPINDRSFCRSRPMNGRLK